MKYILSIDSGSTGIRAVLFDQNGQIIAREYEKVQQLTPEPGAMEFDPEALWQALLSVSKKILDNSTCDVKDIAALGICNQRGTFVLWDRKTGEPVTNFIGWADVRAAKTCEKIIKHNFKWKFMKFVTKIASVFHPMLRTAAKMRLNTDHSIVRLKWLLDSQPELRQRCKAREIAFSTIDSWFIYKLTGGKVHATDYSNAVVTNLYNPYWRRWNGIFMFIFDIAPIIFPDVKDTNGDFGVTDPGAFHNVSIPIRAAVGDQMAALFGDCCFEPGSVKGSFGSGAFVDMNIGQKSIATKRGLLPMVAWCLNGKLTNMVEGSIATAGLLVDWLDRGLGLADSPEVLNELAAQCDDAEGVVFIPTSAGIQYPYFIPEARGCIFGLSLATRKCHVARAVLEGIALALTEIIDTMRRDIKKPITTIKVDGGVSRSDILLHCLADFANVTVERSQKSEMAATGVAYFAGLGVGIWKNLDELKQLEKKSTTFEPKITAEARKNKIKLWKKSITAMLSAYAP